MATITEQIATLNQVKTNIKNKLTGKGIDMSNVPFTGYSGKIDTLKIASGNAGAGDVLTGKTFSNSTNVGLSGSMANNGAVNKTITPSLSSQTYTIPAGYHNGSGKVTIAAAPTSLVDGDAVESNVLEGSTFFCDSYVKKTGTMPNLSASSGIQYTSSNATKVIVGDTCFIQKNTDGVTRLLIRYNGANGYIASNTLVSIPVLNINMTTLRNAVEDAKPWVTKTGTHTTQSLSFALGGSQTVTGSTFTAVKPTKLHLQYELVCREWTVDHTVRVEGLTEAGSWVTLCTHTKRLDGDSSNASAYTMSYNGNVSVSTSQKIKQLRVYMDGRYWANTVTVKIVEWQVKE